MGLVHHRDRASQYLSIKYREWLAEAGIEPSVGASAIAMTTPMLRRSMACSRPKSSIDAAHGAASRPSNTQDCMGRLVQQRRLLEPIGNIFPAEAEANFYAALETEAMAAELRSISLRQTRCGSTCCFVAARTVTIWNAATQHGASSTDGKGSAATSSTRRAVKQTVVPFEFVSHIPLPAGVPDAVISRHDATPLQPSFSQCAGGLRSGGAEP